MATYASQIFVLHYGTHYISRIRIGGHIIEDNFIKSKDLYTNDTTMKSMQTTAKVGFLATVDVSVNAGYQKTISDANMKKYQDQVVNRRIFANGGQPYLMDMPLSQWESTIEDNPVILKRTLENITMAIDLKQINEIEQFYVYEAVKEINKAINTYIETNSIYGCMDRNSNSFNWFANADDNSCNQSVSNIQFGGVILTCQIQWITNNDSTYRLNDTCNEFKIYTNTEQCSSGFTRNLVYTSVKIQSIERTESYSCGFLGLFTCNRTKPIGTASRTINLYSCTRNNTGLIQYVHLVVRIHQVK
ncbi:hypothetical protein I4U23_005173 [Adineta vaga]|nr:hypothetical protein I4U23_005173 [Adineta vaga]